MRLIDLFWNPYPDIRQYELTHYCIALSVLTKYDKKAAKFYTFSNNLRRQSYLYLPVHMIDSKVSIPIPPFFEVEVGVVECFGEIKSEISHFELVSMIGDCDKMSEDIIKRKDKEIQTCGDLTDSKLKKLLNKFNSELQEAFNVHEAEAIADTLTEDFIDSAKVSVQVGKKAKDGKKEKSKIEKCLSFVFLMFYHSHTCER